MKFFSKWKMFATALALGGALLYGAETAPVVASDHDDGETQIKSRNLSLTDLYVFREDWQTGVASDANNLIFVMNTNPRSLPRQQYFFNTLATYSFHVDRKSGVDAAADGGDDLRFDFRFAEPDANGQQAFTMDLVTLDSNGNPTNQAGVTGGLTTPAPPLIGAPNPAPVNNSFTVGGETVTVFAGLREDPFFFDVEQFFKVRAFLAGAGPDPSPGGANAPFFTPDNAVDFAQGYNVNAIVMRVPISLLQASSETTFDVWESVTLPNNVAALQ
jgi:hypothetical protein